MDKKRYQPIRLLRQCSGQIRSGLIVNQKGQALLIIILIVAVGLTIGLSLISRSVTDIRISSDQEESARVFSVAEAGIEEALKLGSAPASFSLGGITAKVSELTEQVLIGGGAQFIFSNGVGEGASQSVWLVDHIGENINSTVYYSGSSIKLYWGKNGTPNDDQYTPALEAILYYKSGAIFKVSRWAIDPYTSRTNGFDHTVTETCLLAGSTFGFCKVIDLPGASVPYLMKLKLLYSSDTVHILGVEAQGVGVTIPAQGECYESTANSNSGITRKVRQCKYYKSPPDGFDYVVFSAGDLVK